MIAYAPGWDGDEKFIFLPLMAEAEDIYEKLGRPRGELIEGAKTLEKVITEVSLNEDEAGLGR